MPLLFSSTLLFLPTMSSSPFIKALKSPFILLYFLALLLHLSLAAAKERYFKWEVENMLWSPDSVDSMVMGINGQFPGPTIRANVGDTVVVELTNKLHTEGVVIHWHGIRQCGTPWADGTASISQCAINPGETFNYKFNVDKAGTYFYHGHYGMQRSAGLYGSLIVDPIHRKEEPFHYNGEFNLLLSDWWHQSVHRQEVSLSSREFHWIGEPQSLLINGKGQYNCSLAGQYMNPPLSQCDPEGKTQCTPEVLHVEPMKAYRIRIASTTALASLNVAIDNHKMEVVEADGNYVKPFVVDNLDIHSGESYSVLIHTDQNSTLNYWVSVSVIGREPKTPPALAILTYRKETPPKLPKSSLPVAPQWNDYDHMKSFSNKIFATKDFPDHYHYHEHHHHHRQIILLNSQNNITGYTKWYINNISLILPTTPYLGSIKFRLNNKNPPYNFPQHYHEIKPPMNPTQGNGLYSLEYEDTIDVILQNTADSKNKSEIHPWHLHGHDFWVLGYGEGKFSEKTDVKKFNLKNPPLRNTVVLYPHGWTAIRFVADNPGVWAFHCHIEPHLHMGMGVIFAEAVDSIRKMPIPNEALGCGLTAKMMINGHSPSGHGPGGPGGHSPKGPGGPGGHGP